MTPMLYRRFGRTGLSMPVFTCGGMRYQHSWQDASPAKIPAANQENLERCIRRAVELGISHIETARGYGTSEIQLGRILPQFPREKLIVQTKVAPMPAKEYLKTFDRSMKNLRLDHVDLLSLHGINNRDLLRASLKKGGALEAARKIQAEGRARFIGFSTHAACDVIAETVETGEFDYVNLHWYWINQVNWPAVEAAARRDMGVFIISPNDKGGKLYEPTKKLARLCAPLSPMVFNDLFCLMRPEVHTLSLGVARPEDFDEHIKALGFLDGAAELVPPIVARLREAVEDALGRGWCENWDKGIPPWEKIPGEINVWEIVRLWAAAKALDMVAFGRMRYNLLGNAEHWFPGKNAAQFDEKKMAAALAGSPLAARLPAILREAHEMLADAPAQRLSKSD